MTPEFKAAQDAWVAYHGAKHQEECPTMPPTFRRGFEDGAKWMQSEIAKKLCQWCEMGWLMELPASGGAYHKIPPKNRPTSYVNKKCECPEVWEYETPRS